MVREVLAYFRGDREYWRAHYKKLEEKLSSSTDTEIIRGSNRYNIKEVLCWAGIPVALGVMEVGMNIAPPEHPQILAYFVGSALSGFAIASIAVAIHTVLFNEHSAVFDEASRRPSLRVVRRIPYIANLQQI